jgi:hypothetical protein
LVALGVLFECIVPRFGLCVSYVGFLILIGEIRPSIRWRAFKQWVLALTFLWLLLTLPDGSGLWAKGWGFPYEFGFHQNGHLHVASFPALMADIGLALVVILGVASLCQWSRSERLEP